MYHPVPKVCILPSKNSVAMIIVLLCEMECVMTVIVQFRLYTKQ